MSLNLSKASAPGCIPMRVLKNCEPKRSYLLAEPFNKCLKESFFLDCWKIWSVVPVFKHVWERYTAKNYHPVSLPSVVSSFFEKLVNIRIADHLDKYSLFSTWYIRGFWQSLARWSSSQTSVLWNFKSDIWPYFFFFQ